MDERQIRDALRDLAEEVGASSEPARNEPKRDDYDEASLERKLHEIESHLQTSKTEAKQAISKALVIIGQRNDRLNALAMEVARRLGPIEFEDPDGESVKAHAAELLRDPELAKRLLD